VQPQADLYSGKRRSIQSERPAGGGRTGATLNGPSLSDLRALRPRLGFEATAATQRHCVPSVTVPLAL
jgi:hypothetical protein